MQTYRKLWRNPDEREKITQERRLSTPVFFMHQLSLFSLLTITLRKSLPHAIFENIIHFINHYTAGLQRSIHSQKYTAFLLNNQKIILLSLNFSILFATYVKLTIMYSSTIITTTDHYDSNNVVKYKRTHSQTFAYTPTNIGHYPQLSSH